MYKSRQRYYGQKGKIVGTLRRKQRRPRASSYGLGTGSRIVHSGATCKAQRSSSIRGYCQSECGGVGWFLRIGDTCVVGEESGEGSPCLGHRTSREWGPCDSPRQQRMCCLSSRAPV